MDVNERTGCIVDYDIVRRTGIIRRLCFSKFHQNLWTIQQTSTLLISFSFCFARFQLDPLEDASRRGLLEDVNAAICSRLPRGARMQAFGSYPAVNPVKQSSSNSTILSSLLCACLLSYTGLHHRFTNNVYLVFFGDVLLIYELSYHHFAVYHVVRVCQYSRATWTCPSLGWV